MGVPGRWLADFEKALRAPDDLPLAKLFRADAHWRDLLALTWRVKTVSGAAAFLAELKRRAEKEGAGGLSGRPVAARRPPRGPLRGGRGRPSASSPGEAAAPAFCAWPRTGSAGRCSLRSRRSRAPGRRPGPGIRRC